MFKITKYLSIALLAVVALFCCNNEDSQPQETVHRLDSFLYSASNDNLGQVVVELYPWSQASRLWMETQQNVCCPSRSLDGNQVAYLVREKLEMCSLWVANYDAQNAILIGGLYPCSSSHVNIEWSFDGQYIAFRTGSDIDTEMVYVLDAATGHEIIAVTGRDFAWSKMSDQLVVYKTREHNIGGLEVIDIPGGTGYWLLDVYLPGQQSLDWMPDQQSIVFAANIDREVTNPTTIYTIDADGNNFHELTQDTAGFEYRDISNIRVSPNGKYLIFGSSFHTREGVSGVGGLMVLDLNSGKVRHLASWITGPVAWSPDSKYIVFSSIEDPQGNKVDGWELFLVALDDGGIRQLTYNGADPISLTW